MSWQDYVRQAEHNEKFAYSIGDGSWEKTPYRDWVATALFYAALNWIQAFLESKNYRPGSHAVRDKYVTTLAELKPISRVYSDLQHDSENARYECVVPTAKALTEYHVPRLQQIKKQIGKLLPAHD